MDENELIPCPFCGGRFEYDNDEYDGAYGEWWKCQTCGAQVWEQEYLNTRPAEDALRAQIAARDAEIARLREVIGMVEFVRDDWFDELQCPWCEHRGHDGEPPKHSPTCPRQEALASSVTDNVTDGE